MKKNQISERITGRLFGLFLLLTSVQASDIKGELAMFFRSNDTDIKASTIGLHYLPGYQHDNSLNQKWRYDIDIQGKLSWHSEADSFSFGKEAASFDPYRASLHLQTNRYEYILGLHKINFGPARVLRPLMWFDAVDPRDPIGLTTGVWGVSAHYFYDFGWSSRAWLFRSGDPKGMESLAGKSGAVETGGRLFAPILSGEMGLSTHFRLVDTENLPLTDPDLYEWRWALDGYWDIGPGLWFESMYKHQSSESGTFLDEVLTTIGSDYTLDAGNGIYLLVEHMLINLRNSPLIPETDNQLSAVMFTYSLNMFDQIMGLYLYNWDASSSHTYVSWNQNYDNWLISFAGFLSTDPDTENPLLQTEGFGGNGLQLTLIFNY